MPYKNKEDRKACQKRYEVSHKEQKKQYVLDHPEQRKQTTAKYRQNHKEQLNAYNVKYNAEHPSSAIDSYYNRIQKPIMRQWSIWLQSQPCIKCGAINDSCTHHIDAETKLFNCGERFGQNQERLLEELKKCEILCRSCHSKLHNELRKAEI